MEKLKKNKKGFTLIEIIVVLIIMGILIAIAAPAMLSYVGKAEDQRDLANARAGFLGAQTLVLTERVEDRNATDAELAAKINAAAVNTEIGEADLVNAINCEVDTKKVVQCSVQLEADSRWANFTANGEANMTDVDNPTVEAPTPAAP